MNSFNCYYCNKSLQFANGFYNCPICPNTQFIHGYHNSYINIIWIVFNFKPYYIDINLQTKQLFLYKDMSNVSLISLDYIPKINPTNAKHWLDKFLSIKAFA